MTAIVLKDRVKETTSTAGTSDFVLGGASSGYQAFSVIGPNNYTYYCCFDNATGDWEVGYGQYTTTAGGTLVRITILSNSAATTSKIAFAAGPKDVFITYPAEKAIYEEDTGNVLIDGGPITVVGQGVTTYTTFSAALGEMYGNVNSFAQLYARNLLDDTEASADMIVYRNNTVTEDANFLDMGINSSSFDSTTWPIFTPGSMYLYGNGGEMFIGSETSDVVFFAGGVDTTDEVGRFSASTGDLTLVDGLNVGGVLDVTGATTFGSTVLLNADPTLALQAATKAYVDNAASTGIHIHTPVAAETSAALSAVYTQGGTTFNITDITGTNTVVTSTTHGLSVNDQIWLTTTAGNGLSTNTAYFVYATPTTTSLQLSTTYGGPLLTGLTNASGLSYATRANSGVGAFLEASANEVLPVAGVSVSDRVLVYNQATSYWNGVYTVTSLGSVGSKWKLTRATDADYYSPSDTDGLSEGDYFLVQSNSESYVLTTPGAIIIGYTGITYTLFASVPTYTGGTNIDVSGGVISLTGTVAATNGGTGTATVATGDLLYGSATNTWSKLTKGSAYTVLTMDASGTNVQWNSLNLGSSNAVTGQLGATYGGTGQSNYAVGDMLYSGTADTLSRLAGNTTTTKKFLGQTGTGSGSAAPVWEQPAASDITGLAPSATTDTTNASNITSGTLPTGRLSGSYTGITGVGTLAAGTWNGSTVGPTYGGTGFASYAVGDLLYADTTTTLGKLADVAVGNALISGGVSAAPSWGKIGLATHVSGTLPAANGGTGNTTGQAASVANSLTINNGGAGSASGSTYNGSGAITISYNSIGASPTAGSSSITTVGTITSGTWTGTAIAVANGGTGSSSASGARTNLGATTVGANLFTLVNPSAVTFPRFNADNTVSSLDAASFRTAIGAGTSSTTGTVTSVGGTGSYGGLTLTGTVTSSGNLTLGGTPTGTWPISVSGSAASATTADLSSYAGGAVQENTQTISSNYTMTSGRSGVSAGPITISTGVTVTIPTGSSWVVV